MKPESKNQEQKSGDRPFIVPIFIPHAGCSHRCVFCNQSAITGIKGKLYPEHLRPQISQFLKYKGERRSRVQIAFYGGNFLGLAADEVHRLLRVAAEFVREGSADSIRFSTRPDTIAGNRLDMIKPFPVTTVEVGVQSMDDRVLARANRGHKSADTQKALNLLKQEKYEIGAQLMVGLPEDSAACMLASAQRIADLNPDFVRIYPTIVFAGSPLAMRYQKKKYIPLSLDDAVDQVKDLYLFFKKKNIRVVRMGLHVSDECKNGATILGGPYHPAFGHLVHCKIFLDNAIRAIELERPQTNALTLFVHPRSIPRMRGVNNSNVQKLQRTYGFDTVRILPHALLAEDSVMLG